MARSVLLLLLLLGRTTLMMISLQLMGRRQS